LSCNFPLLVDYPPIEVSSIIRPQQFALTEAGLQVPRDLALVGFDDIPTARYITPPLTTVRVRMTDMGGRALDCLAFEIDHPDGTKNSVQVLQTELVVRASCGSPKVAVHFTV
jgi:LacI family transcriptional regulator